MDFHRAIGSSNAIPRNCYLHSLFCMDAPGNRICDDGATALVEGLKEMRKLEKLDLGSEC